MLSGAVLSSTLIGTSYAQKSATSTFSGPPPPSNDIAIAQQSKDVLTGLIDTCWKMELFLVFDRMHS
jgi:hypothetical protein